MFSSLVPLVRARASRVAPPRPATPAVSLALAPPRRAPAVPARAGPPGEPFRGLHPPRTEPVDAEGASAELERRLGEALKTAELECSVDDDDSIDLPACASAYDVVEEISAARADARARERIALDEDPMEARSRAAGGGDGGLGRRRGIAPTGRPPTRPQRFCRENPEGEDAAECRAFDD